MIYNLVKMSYLTHDAGMDWLDADIFTVQVQSVHQRLSRPDQFIALAIG